MSHTPTPHTTGNLASKAGISYTYADTAHKHAVTSLSNGNTYTYDANGNQITRPVGGITHTLTYDGENRLVNVMNGSTTIATFVYDGDGQRVKSTLNGVTTTFVGNYYEKTGTNITKYYYAGTARVAMRNTSVKYLFGDQLGSTSVTTSSSGVIGSQERYKPFGEMYYISGTLPTRYTFTGQYSYTINTNEIGLMYYGARFYDPALGRFASADTIIPGAGNPMAWDRYAYTLNNPVKYTDPSGHMVACDNGDSCRRDSTPILYKLVNDGQAFTHDEANAIKAKVWDVARTEARAVTQINLNYKRSGEPEEMIPYLTPEEIFLLIHNGPIVFTRSSETRIGYVGQTFASNKITFYNLIGANCNCLIPNYMADYPNVIVHEIIHAIDYSDNYWGEGVPGELLNRTDDGFYGQMNYWQFGGDDTGQEIFADMGVGWVYDTWGNNRGKANWMNANIGPILFSRLGY